MGPRAVLLPSSGVPPERSEECGVLIAATAERLLARSSTLADGLVRAVLERLEIFQAHAGLADDLYEAGRANTANLLESLRSWSPPEEMGPTRDVFEWARALVARGLSFETLRRVLYLAQSDFHQIWHEELVAQAAPQDVLLEAVGASSAFLFLWFDANTLQLGEAYEQELQRRAGGMEAYRAQTIAAILAGELLDPVLAGARLNHDLNRTHIAFIVWHANTTPAPASMVLDELGSRVARTLGGGRASWLCDRASSRTINGWVATVSIGTGAREATAQRLRGTGGRVALGKPGFGLQGFRASHEQAACAQRVMRLLSRQDEVATYQDLAILDLLTRDTDTARDVCADVLGPLAAQDTNARRLRTTLCTFLDEGQSYARAARRLGVHDSTVTYRVRRALELCGSPDASAYALRAALELSPLLDGDRHREV